jgi:hypothetical protein
MCEACGTPCGLTGPMYGLASEGNRWWCDGCEKVKGAVFLRKQKLCEGCGLKRPHYGLASEGKWRWCDDCGKAKEAVFLRKRKMCECCGLKVSSYGLAAVEGKRRWCEDYGEVRGVLDISMVTACGLFSRWEKRQSKQTRAALASTRPASSSQAGGISRRIGPKKRAKRPKRARAAILAVARRPSPSSTFGYRLGMEAHGVHPAARAAATKRSRCTPLQALQATRAHAAAEAALKADPKVKFAGLAQNLGQLLASRRLITCPRRSLNLRASFSSGAHVCASIHASICEKLMEWQRT